MVPVYIVKADELKNGIEFDKAQIRYLQCPARIGFREVKKRLVDVLVHNKIATEATLETVRLWKAANYDKLNDSFKEIKLSDDNVDGNKDGV